MKSKAKGSHAHIIERRNDLLRQQINNSDTKNFGFLSVYNNNEDEANTALKSWFLNVLLESLDSVVTHDRGICSCLQDFAAANIMHVDEKEEKTYDAIQTRRFRLVGACCLGPHKDATL